MIALGAIILLFCLINSSTLFGADELKYQLPDIAKDDIAGKIELIKNQVVDPSEDSYASVDRIMTLINEMISEDYNYAPEEASPLTYAEVLVILHQCLDSRISNFDSKVNEFESMLNNKVIDKPEYYEARDIEKRLLMPVRDAANNAFRNEWFMNLPAECNTVSPSELSTEMSASNIMNLKTALREKIQTANNRLATEYKDIEQPPMNSREFVGKHKSLTITSIILLVAFIYLLVHVKRKFFSRRLNVGDKKYSDLHDFITPYVAYANRNLYAKTDMLKQNLNFSNLNELIGFLEKGILAKLRDIIRLPMESMGDSSFNFTWKEKRLIKKFSPEFVQEVLNKGSIKNQSAYLKSMKGVNVSNIEHTVTVRVLGNIYSLRDKNKTQASEKNIMAYTLLAKKISAWYYSLVYYWLLEYQNIILLSLEKHEKDVVSVLESELTQSKQTYPVNTKSYHALLNKKLNALFEERLKDAGKPYVTYFDKLFKTLSGKTRMWVNRCTLYTEEELLGFYQKLLPYPRKVSAGRKVLGLATSWKKK